MCVAEDVLNGLRTRLERMSRVSATNKANHKRFDDTHGVEYYRGECEGLRLALAVMAELEAHYKENR